MKTRWGIYYQNIGGTSPVIAYLSDLVHSSAAEKIGQFLAQLLDHPMELRETRRRSGPVYRPNPSLVHHGMIRRADWHLLQDPGGDAVPLPLADLYAIHPREAHKIAALLATALNRAVMMLDNRDLPPGLADHPLTEIEPLRGRRRLSNPAGAPVVGEVWTSASGRCRILSATAGRIQVLHLGSGKREWFDRAEFLASYRAPRARNPYRGPAIDQSLLSPSGRMSKRSRAAAMKREHARLFPPGVWDAPAPTGAEQTRQRVVALLRSAANLRELADRGMSARKFRKQVAALEAQAATLGKNPAYRIKSARIARRARGRGSNPRPGMLMQRGWLAASLLDKTLRAAIDATARRGPHGPQFLKARDQVATWLDRGGRYPKAAIQVLISVAARTPNPKGRNPGPGDSYYHGGTLAADGWVEMTRAQWAKVHRDFKGFAEEWTDFGKAFGAGTPSVMGREATGTVLRPVRITDAPSLGRRVPRTVTNRSPEGVPPTVGNFLEVLATKLTQADQREERYERKRRIPVNIHRLAHYMGALGRVRVAVKGIEQSSDPTALQRMLAAMHNEFTEGFGPVKTVEKQVAEYTQRGTLPSLVRARRDPNPKRPKSAPWRMTVNEFVDLRSQGPHRLELFEAVAIHEAEVDAALAAGQPVPARVLAEHKLRGPKANRRHVTTRKTKRNPGSVRERAARTFQKWHEFPPGGSRRVKGPNPRIPQTLVQLGELHAVTYKSNKWTGKPTLYEHRTKRPRPILATDPDGQDVHIVGGNMKVTADGLVN